MTFSVSLQGNSTTQSLRLKSMNSQLSDLQRQLATQKKHDKISGFGTKAFRIQDLHEQNKKLDIYQENTKRVSTRMQMMTESLEQMVTSAQDVQDTILTQTREGEVDLSDIQNIADTSMRFMQDLLNTSDGSRYLFSGSASSSKPMDNMAALESNVNAEVSKWLDGTQTFDEMMTSIDSYTDEQLGLSSDLAGAGKTTTKISDSVDVDYTAKANSDAFKNVIKGMALAKAAQFPDAATDIGTEAEFHKLLDTANNYLEDGIQGMRDTGFDLGAEYNLLKRVDEQNKSDSNMSQSLISDMEDADPTEVVVQIQSLQTQLTSSYEVTRIMSQLSLVNYM